MDRYVAVTDRPLETPLMAGAISVKLDHSWMSLKRYSVATELHSYAVTQDTQGGTGVKQTWIGVTHCGHFWARAVHCASGWGQSVGTGLLLRLLLLTLAATAPLPARANIAVGSSGQAAYSMPIGVPPGIAGMAPNLSLSYTDGGINGPLGVGWSLQGISTITRAVNLPYLRPQCRNRRRGD